MTNATVISYGTDSRQVVQIYTNQSASQSLLENHSPLLIFVHGGAWKDGKIEDHGDLARYISDHGVAVALIEYRLSLPGNGIRHPDHINDVHAALELLWESTTSARYRYDTNGAILVGHSVGGWMVLSAALASEEAIDDGPVANMPPLRSDIRKQIRAFVAVESIFSLAGLARHYPSYQSFLVPAFYPPETQADTSLQALAKVGVESWSIAPVGSYFAAGKPNIHIIHTADDELLSVEYNEEGVRLLQAKGLDLVIDLTSCQGKHDDMLHTEAFWQRLMSIMNVQ